MVPLCVWAQNSKGSIVITRDNAPTLSIDRSEVAKISFEYITLNTLEPVDLGLSVKWANVNLDILHEGKVVSVPEDYGGYYGWADPTGLLTESNVNLYPGPIRPESITGGEYDIAAQQLGNGWRLPTTDEFNELLTLHWERTSLNDVNGIKFTADNGNWIFLPYAGYRYGEKCFQQGVYGYYWTGDRHATNANFSADLNIGADICRVANQNIYNGCSIRAVKATE